MEDLLIGCVRRATNGPLLRRCAQVLDVCQHHIGGPAVELGILAAPLRRDVRGDPDIRDYVLVTRVLVDAQAPEHKEPVPVVELAGEAAELGAEARERKRVRRYVAQR